ncbi:DUF1045 domain-containing protein [Curvivirga sp.]|uniref:DUF1045 domain-containing protein n=1 Tax=Curvivirga sp. TaxID=2856848 RepID=UPI003B5CD26C
MNYKRYAIYYAPEDQSELGKFGNHWLGRNPTTKSILSYPDIKNISPAQIKEITLSPSRYGFHGTLKPPFILEDGFNFSDFESKTLEYARQIKPFNIGTLKLARIGKFLALIPATKSEALYDLAAKLVENLDIFRKAASEDEINKRRVAGLSNRQDVLLLKWGYPYVFEEFRFHLTLTDKLDENRLNWLEPILSNYLEPLTTAPIKIENICIFGDPGNGGAFDLLKRIKLGGV